METSTNAELNATSLNLRTLFTRFGNLFKIPENQRKYVWTTQQFETLLVDLHDNFANGQPSFLGTVCLSEEVRKNDKSESFLIVDGQQRITTLGILLHILNEKLGISEDVVPPAFMAKLTEMPKGPLKPGIPYMRIADLLKSSACCSEEFRDYLLDKVCFSVLQVPAAIQHKIFDSVNSTGKALEIQELVYNSLYERTKEKQSVLTDNWNKFLGLMAGLEEAGASQEFSRDDALDQNQDDSSVSDAPEADENASNQTNGTRSNTQQGKQLNFRHFFTAFVRSDCTKRYSRDLYRALELRLEGLAAQGNKDGSALAGDILVAARYYAMFVAPMDQINNQWFKKCFPDADDAFIHALVRFSTLHLGDALPLLMRLAGNGSCAKKLTAYMDGIFQVYLLARVTQNRRLRQAVLRRLPGLDMEIAGMLKSTDSQHIQEKTLSTTVVQIALIGSLKAQYDESIENLVSALKLLRYQGNASLITSLLVAQALNQGLDSDDLKNINQNGGFSLEHIIPQKNQGNNDQHQLGNLVLLEKNLNSGAGAKDITKKISEYKKSEFWETEIQDAVESLYDSVERPAKSVLRENLENRTAGVVKALARLFQKVDPLEPQEKNKLAFLRESSEGTRDWLWEWRNPGEKADKSQSDVYYYDDGQNSRTKKGLTIVAIRDSKDSKASEAQLESPNNISIISCTEQLIYLLFKKLSALNPPVTAKNFCDALTAYASPEYNEGYGRYISTEPILRSTDKDPDAKAQNQETIFNFTPPKAPSASANLYLASDQSNYDAAIPSLFENILAELGISQDCLDPVYLEYEKEDFRIKNHSFFSKYAYMFGDINKYWKILQAESNDRIPEAEKAKAETQAKAAEEIGQDFKAGSFVSSEVMTLAQFSDKFQHINIPMYQRKYVWTEENWTRLTADCESGDLFLGVLLLGDRGDGTYDLIDGQQRLTTLSYLLPDLRLKDHISFSDTALSDDFKNGTGVYTNLQAFAEMPKLPKNTAGKLRFLVLTLQKDHIGRAGELFTTVNGRGLRLTPGEIIKNFILMNVSTFKGENETDEGFRKKVSPMWKDPEAFEHFIKAYLDMTQQGTISKAQMVSSMKQLAEEDGEETTHIPIQDNADEGSSAKPPALDPDCWNLWEMILDEYVAGTLPSDCNLLCQSLCTFFKLSPLNQVIVSKKTKFFTEMPKYWGYYNAITQTTGNGPYGLDEKIKGELYFHRLVGTHTTLPPLLYYFARWQEASDADKGAKREAFLRVLRSLTDAFLICHLCCYETQLKSMDKRMAALCGQVSVETDGCLPFRDVFGMDESAQPWTLLKRGLEQDLYHKRQSLALLLVWRCEQALHENEGVFYNTVCDASTGKLIPSVEHIIPQKKGTLSVDRAWNYILLEKKLNSSAKDKGFSEKQNSYRKSSFKTAQRLTGENVPDCPTPEELQNWMAACLTGPKGLYYLRDHHQKA